MKDTPGDASCHAAVPSGADEVMTSAYSWPRRRGGHSGVANVTGTTAAPPERATVARRATDGSATVAVMSGACARGASGRLVVELTPHSAAEKVSPARPVTDTKIDTLAMRWPHCVALKSTAPPLPRAVDRKGRAAKRPSSLADAAARSASGCTSAAATAAENEALVGRACAHAFMLAVESASTPTRGSDGAPPMKIEGRVWRTSGDQTMPLPASTPTGDAATLAAPPGGLRAPAVAASAAATEGAEGTAPASPSVRVPPRRRKELAAAPARATPQTPPPASQRRGREPGAALTTHAYTPWPTGGKADGESHHVTCAGAPAAAMATDTPCAPRSGTDGTPALTLTAHSCPVTR